SFVYSSDFQLLERIQCADERAVSYLRLLALSHDYLVDLVGVHRSLRPSLHEHCRQVFAILQAFPEKTSCKPELMSHLPEDYKKKKIFSEMVIALPFFVCRAGSNRAVNLRRK